MPTTAEPEAGMKMLDPRGWPAEAREAMAQLDDSFPPVLERREIRRRHYRTMGLLKIPIEGGEYVFQTVYTRDINPWHIGVICQEQLPVGQMAELETRWPDGRVNRLICHVRRCQEFTPGWYEANLHFADEEPSFTFGW